jgi:hypothetical protein
VPEKPLPPEQERISLKEASERFDPPRTKKAVEQMLQRGSLDFAREKDEESGRTRRVVTTEAWLEEYVRGSGGKARLREAGAPRDWVLHEPLFQRADREPTTEGPLQRLVRELSEENLRLKLRVAELESKLERS